MASSINASTSGAGGVITTADNSGILNLQSGGVTVATISPTGIQMASNTAPAFSVYLGTTQNITAGTGTKILFDTKVFDTNNNFSTSTSRFTPTVAGYYQFNVSVDYTYSTGTVTRAIIQIYKNGASYQVPFDINSQVVRGCTSFLYYMNGTTDYVEVYGWLFGVSSPGFASGNTTMFSGAMIRSA